MKGIRSSGRDDRLIIAEHFQVEAASCASLQTCILEKVAGDSGRKHWRNDQRYIESDKKNQLFHISHRCMN
jgi:hypothetical protein